MSDIGTGTITGIFKIALVMRLIAQQIELGFIAVNKETVRSY